MAVIQPKTTFLEKRNYVNKPDYTESFDESFYFNSEDEYKKFIQELHGKMSYKRKKQLAQTKSLIKKHKKLLNDFDYND